MQRAFAILALLGVVAMASPADASSKKPHTHQVYPGQTLGMIAKRYNVSIDAICTANGVRRGDPIKPRQTLVIPARGDTDGTLARAFRLERDAADKPSADKPTQPAAHQETAKPQKSAKPEKTKKKPADEFVKKPKRRGYLTINGPSGTWRGYAVGKDGRVTGKARDGFEKVLASWRTGKRERIHGRLIRMLTKVSDHFGGRPIRIVSGFRPASSSQYTPHSQHNIGRAVDFSIPGVPNELVRDYCRTLHKVGVGYYPNSSFVHLDVRDVQTYWIDYSGPGEAPRYATGQGRDPATPAPRGSKSTPAEPAGS
jgi:LysM repeat protein